MSINPLNDISKVYLEQVSVASRARNAVADDRLDAEQEKTNASMDKLRKQTKRFDRASASDAARKVERDVKKSSTYGPQRPKPGTVTGRRIEDPKPTGSKPKGYRVEETEIDEAQKPNDGNLANNYPPYDKITRGDVIAGRLGKDEMGGKKKKSKGVKEGFSNWRQDLSEVMGETEDNKQIKEKKVNNKVKINPKLGEAVEEIGGVLLEMVEIDEVDFVVESVYGELIEEGYEEDDIEEALEYALTEANVTFGHDTPTGEKKRGNLVKAVGRLARQKLSSKVRGAKASAKAAVARGARKVAKGALGVARKMEGDDNKANPRSKGAKPTSAPKRPPSAAGTKEKVSSGSYKAPATTKKKAEKPADPWEGTASTPPKAKAKKAAAPKAKAPAAPKRKRKASKLDSLLTSIRNEEVQIDEKALSKQQQKFMGMVYAVKKGEMEAPSPEVAKAAAGMTKQQAKDFAKTKHKGLPEVKEAMDDSVEMSSTASGTSSVDDKKMEQQRKKIQMQKVRDLTVRLAAARKGVY